MATAPIGRWGAVLAAVLPLGLAAALGLLGVLSHELWRDEAYTWLVVRASGSAAALLDNLGWNGHPRLYYLLCYALHGLFASPLALQLSNLALALGATALFLQAAPLSPVQRVLYALGFYPLYQYGVIARSYSLFLLLLFLFLALRRHGRRGAAILALAALAQVHALGLAFAAVLLGWELVVAHGAYRSSRWAPRERSLLWAAAVACASFLLAAWQLAPPGGGVRVVRPDTAQVLLQAFASGFLPDFGPLQGSPVQLGGGLCVAALSLLCLGRGRALGAYLLLGLPLLLFFALVYPGHRWHHGLLFVALLVSLCLEGVPPRRLARGALTALLGLHAALGVGAVLQDVWRPYSNGAQAAAALRAAGRAGSPLVGLTVLPQGGPAPLYRFEIDQIQPLLLGLPAGRAYDPRARRLEPFWRHYSEPAYFPPMDAQAAGRAIADVAAARGGHVTVALVLPDGGAWPAPPGLVPLSRFPPTFDYGEHLALYQFP